MRLRYYLEAALVYTAYGFFRLLPLRLSSTVGGWIGRHIGYHLPLTHRARKNLQLVMPELTAQERERLLQDMWDNLGRVIGETPHLPGLQGEHFSQYVEITGQEHLQAAVEGGKGFIFFSAHLGNWEIGLHSAAELGCPLCLIYRPANNPLVDRLIRTSREGRHDGLLPKGKEGARGILAHLKAGKPVGMLIDQKMNDGITVPFFGRDANTPSAIAEFALKFDVPLLPASVERLKGAQFRVTIHPPLETRNKNVHEIMTEANAMMEGWIRLHPEQWFWLHRRWGKI